MTRGGSKRRAQTHSSLLIQHIPVSVSVSVSVPSFPPPLLFLRKGDERDHFLCRLTKKMEKLIRLPFIARYRPVLVNPPPPTTTTIFSPYISHLLAHYLKKKKRGTWTPTVEGTINKKDATLIFHGYVTGTGFWGDRLELRNRDV